MKKLLRNDVSPSKIEGLLFIPIHYLILILDNMVLL